MAKSEILKQLANDEIAIDKALKRLMLFANDLGDNELAEWADKELSGYNQNDELPDYRKVWVANVLISGIKGNAYNAIKYDRMSIPLHLYIPDKEFLNSICTLNIAEPISTIIQKANSPQDTIFSRSLLELNELIWSREKISCSAIEQPIQPPQFADILAKITQKLLKIFMKLDKEYGNLDELDIDTTGISQKQIDKTAAEIKQLIYVDSVTVNNTDYGKAKFKGANIANGDNNRQTNKNEKKKLKDSNTGSGVNATNRTTEISPTIEADGILGKVFKNKKGSK